MLHFSISPMLKEAVELRIDELGRAKDAFIRHYQSDAPSAANNDTIVRVKNLLEEITTLNPELENDDDLDIMARYMNQASTNHVLSESKVLKFEQQLRGKLSMHLSRLEVSTLHCQLLREALDTGYTDILAFDKPESVDLEEDFEVVEQEFDDVLERFEKKTFAAGDTNTEEVKTYLCGLLDDGGDLSKLEELRDELQTFETELQTDGLEMDQDFLMWCILDILKNGIISEERKKTLEGYLQSPIALRELVSVLNIKPVRNFAYKDAEKGLPVTALQDADGHYSIVVEEGVIDSLFLRALGMRWAMKLKSCLNQFKRDSSAFMSPNLSEGEADKRSYFLDRDPGEIPTANVPCSIWPPNFPPVPMPPPPMDMGMGMPPPPPPPPPAVMVVPSKKKYKSMKNRLCYPPQPPPSHCGSIAYRRHANYTQQYFMSRLPTEIGSTPNLKPAEEVQAGLIKTLAVERRIRKGLDGQAHAGSAHFKSLASLLPHQTILTVLEFLGFGQLSLDVFGSFLSAKLNIGPAVRGSPDRILPRARGVPDGHALELVFTEAVMFFLELALSKKTTSVLYRLKDSCYFVGNDEEYKLYQYEVRAFANIMGLEVEMEETQSIGLLSLDTGIETDKVVTYAHRIKKQLQGCNSVLEWVGLWNNTIGTYAAHLFGPLANVFGKAHQEEVKETYNVIYDIIFDGGSLTAHVESLLATSGLTNPPVSIDALIYLPQAYGGLGVKNPFITLGLAQQLPNDPNADLKTYLEDEELYYKRAAENYALFDANVYARKLNYIFNNDKARMDAAVGPGRDLNIFMTKEELVANREKTTYPNLLTPPGYPYVFTSTKLPSLYDVYRDMLSEPKDEMPESEKIRDEVTRLEDKGDMESWRSLSAEDKWVLQLYGDECFEKFGGLEIWIGEHVPQEVLKLVRGVAWEDDDGSSDMTEP
jgi:hypothetical protein